MKIATLFLALVVCEARAAEVISGVPRVIDGDTIEIGARKIRLASIDAPEVDQICLDENQKRWACGGEARDRLLVHIGSGIVDCLPTGSDAYGRVLAICALAREDLNAWMVRQGWALAFVRYSKNYVPDEEAARLTEAGIWRGSFIAPWDWRHRNEQTVILGATSIPSSAQSELLAAVSAVDGPSPKCIIKGNVNRKGDRIYHLPGQLNYSQINMAKGLGERWFCSESEAAGWRRSAR
jgi:endonuclease YncB( thermonuclease family)